VIRHLRQWDFASFLNQVNEAGLDFEKVLIKGVPVERSYQLLIAFG
jgi:hypothetical protein